MARQSFLFSDHSYAQFLEDLKRQIRSAQLKAALAVNQELVLLYWQIGQEILRKQEAEGWGTRVIERLAKDLRREFPDMRGFSARNLKYMRAFALAYPEEAIVQEGLAQNYSGKMSFYVTAVNRLLRTERDEPTIGIILCKSKNQTIVEFALQGNQQPIGVATYQLQSQLPQELQGQLPTIEQLEMEMAEALATIESPAVRALE